MHTCHLCCVICGVTVHVNMWRAAGVSVYLSVDCQGVHFSAIEKASLNQEITAVESRMRIAKNSNFCSTSNHRAAPTELTRTNVLYSATGFPVTSKDRSSILFGHRFDNHICQVFRIVGTFAVLIVVQDEWVYLLLKSLSHVRSTQFLSFRALSSLVAKKEWSSNASSSYQIICSSVHPFFDEDSRYWSSHLSKKVLYPPCLGWRAFCNISLA